jgi:hypothetical protein
MPVAIRTEAGTRPLSRTVTRVDRAEAVLAAIEAVHRLRTSTAPEDATVDAPARLQHWKEATVPIPVSGVKSAGPGVSFPGIPAPLGDDQDLGQNPWANCHDCLWRAPPLTAHGPKCTQRGGILADNMR